MMRVLVFVFLFVFTLPALAITTEQTIDRRSQLLENLKAAKNQAEARAAENAIRRYWLVGPTPEITGKLLNAMQARRYYNFKQSLKLLDEIITRHPDYAEAYNQRAFVYFLQNKMDDALSEILKVLKLEPQHFGALTGQAIIFLHQGRTKLARASLLKAVDIHPWLRERSLLTRLKKEKE